jgi:hypothetical protein
VYDNGDDPPYFSLAGFAVETASEAETVVAVRLAGAFV